MLRLGRLRAVAVTASGVALLGAAAGSAVLFSARQGSPSLSRSTRPATAAAAHRPTATTTTEPPAPTTDPPAPPPTAPAPPAAVQPPQSGCDAALAYLRANANPAFTLECPGNAFGHEAMTCVYRSDYCPGRMVIAIADPCPAAYMNEAANSWILTGQRSGSIDPYGAC